MTRNVSWPAALVALLAMGMVVHGALVYDANQLLLHDSRFALPIDWSGLLTKSYWPTGLWRPLTSLLLGVQVAIGGATNPAVFQTTSLLLYLLTVVVLTRLLARLTGSTVAALAAGALFAAHPVHVEVVASVVGQAEMLATLGLLSGTLVWYNATQKGVTGWTIPLLLGAQCLAALSKEQGFVLPVLLLGQHLLLPRKLPSREARRLAQPLLLVVVLLLLLRIPVTGSVGGETPLPFLASLGVLGRAVTALGVVPDFVRLLVAPIHLQGEYGPPELAVGLPLGWHHLFGFLLVLAAFCAWLHWRRKAPVAALGVWWIVVTWLPSSSLILPAGVMLAERLLFLPSVGLAMVIAGAGAALPKRAQRTGAVLALLVTLLFVFRSIVRVPVWRTPERFFGALTADAPLVYRAWYVSGIAAASRGDSVSAEQLMRHSLTLWNRNPAVHEALGQLLRSEGRCADAVPVLTAGLARDPERTQLRAKLGECLLQTGDSAQAAVVARGGIALGQAAFQDLLRRSGK